MPRGKVNKSDKIREAFEKLGHDARPRDVIAMLAEKKIKVSSAQVSTLKGKLGNGHKNGRLSADGAHVTVEHLLAAKKFIQAVGSIENARAAIDTMGRFLS